MNYAKAIFLIHDGVRGVRVKYAPDSYAGSHAHKGDDVDSVLFKTLDAALKEGDFVIVPTRTRFKMTVCKVTEVDVDPDLEAPGDCRWIIAKVDTAEHERLEKEEAEAVAHIKRANDHMKRKELRAALMETSAAQGLKELPIYHVTENGK